MADKTSKETHKEVSVAEFFEKNRHLLGFNNPQKSLLTSVKEAVDNSLDACEDAKILPDVFVQVKKIREDRYLMIVEDNGPGIIKKHLTKAFGKLLYGSKFQTIGGKQARGQQGIGISAVILYGQLTTGKPAKLISKTKRDKQAHVYSMHIDVKKNEPEIVNSEQINWDKDHGVRIEVFMEAKYIETKQSVLEYIKETAVVNPHVKLTYIDPNDQKMEFPRVTNKLPKPSKMIKPHPHGIELGILKRLLKDTKARTIKSFLTKEFDKVGGGTAGEMLKVAEIDQQILPRLLTPEQQEDLLKGMQDTKVMKPSMDCLSPIGSDFLKKSLESEYDADFVHAITRSPSVYLGRPFEIEVGIVHGGELDAEGPVKLIRFANKVPLLYQEGACAITKAIKKMSWKSYGLQQSSGNMPTGPAIIIVHMTSVWVPFTSEGKEAISDFPEISKEIRLSLQECARSLQRFISRKQKAEIEQKKRDIFINYSDELAESLSKITKKDKIKIKEKLLYIAEAMYSTKGDIEQLKKEVEELGKQEKEGIKEEIAEEELESEREEEKTEFGGDNEK